MNSDASYSDGSRQPPEVAVIGAGQAGLSIGHPVVLSVGSRQKPLPQRLLGRDLFWWLTKACILNKNIDSRVGRKLSTRDTLIGSSPGEMTKRYGVKLEPRLLETDGRRNRRGVTDFPGLYFLGLTWQYTRGSALIGFIKDDAQFIAEQTVRMPVATATAAETHSTERT